MTVTIWRYSHFALAVSSALFILLATVTGAVLAFEPIQNKLQAFTVPGAQELTLAQVIDTLGRQYDEVLEIAADANQSYQVSVISMDESLNGDFYINPFNGQKIAEIPPKHPLFEFMTNLHRSLFLKTTGRIFVGITAFFLLLLALTGSILLIKRQKGIRNFFGRIVKEDVWQYYHVVTGRWMLIPILIIAFTGVYLSLLRFSIIPEAESVLVRRTDNLASEPALAFSEFDIFQEVKLADLRKLEFPFSPDVEDVFILSLQDRQLKINQKTGDIVEELRYPLINIFSDWNFNLHTGTGSILWSLILFVASLNLLFFLYSGLTISYKRLRFRITNKFSPEESEILILVGSENGSTRRFGKVLQTALQKAGQKVYLDELNHYRVYERLRQLVILTSTYGDGDPPANATQFVQLLQQQPPPRPMAYSVVGFGSLAYPNFCQFAIDVDTQLREQDAFQPIGDKPFLIHNRSYPSFKTWAEKWSEQLGLRLDLPAQLHPHKVKLHDFEIIGKRTENDGYTNTFILSLRSKTSRFQSGDLLGVVPPADPVERWYSIAAIPKNNILLAIRRHDLGVCSTYLDELKVGDSLKASIKKNADFHFPDQGKPVILIANGTGIAPYLGMIQRNKGDSPIHLYWGGRTTTSWELYRDWIGRAISNGSLSSFQTAFSREDTAFKYVQDLIRKDGSIIARQLENGASLMICGSILMQNGVLAVLEDISLSHLGIHLNQFQQNGQILMDCY